MEKRRNKIFSKRSKMRRAVARENVPVQNGLGGYPCEFNCVQQFITNGNPKKFAQLDETFRRNALSNEYCTMRDAEAMAIDAKVSRKIVDVLNNVYLDAQNRKKSAYIYGVYQNNHVYKVSRDTYKSIVNGTYFNPKVDSVINHDTDDLRDYITMLKKTENYLPSIGKFHNGKVTSFVRAGVKHTANPDIEHYKAIATALKLVVDDKTSYSAASIGRLFKDQEADIPPEQVIYGPTKQLAVKNNLPFAHYPKCPCLSCETIEDDDVLAWDIDACFWNILCNLEWLSIASPLDSIDEFDRNKDEVLDTYFYLLEGFPKYRGIQYNGKKLSGRLIESFESKGINIRRYIKYVFKPSRKIKNPFPRLRKRLAAITTEENRPYIKKMRNCLTGSLGSMTYKRNDAVFSTSECEADLANECLTTDEFYIIPRDNKRHPTIHNRSIYDQIISESHIQVHNLADYLLMQHPNAHIIKIKCDSVAINPGPFIKRNSYTDSDEEFLSDIESDDECDMLSECDSDSDDEYDSNEVMRVDWSDMGLPIYEDESNFDFEFSPEKYVSGPAPTISAAGKMEWIAAINDMPSISVNDFSWDETSNLLINQPARMGKTYYLNNTLLTDIDSETVLKVVPTNKACSKLSGNVRTVQSMLTHGVHIPARIKYLVIDEISMVSGFDLERILNYCIANKITVILTGDYFQLPSIDDPINPCTSPWFKTLFTNLTIEHSEHCGITKEKYDLMEKYKNGNNDILSYSIPESDIDPTALIVYLAYRNKDVNSWNASVPKEKRIILRCIKTRKGYYTKGQFVIKRGKYYYDYKTTKRIYKMRKSDVVSNMASTVHKFQGDDVTNGFDTRVHLIINAKYMYREMIYTALTRTPGFEFTIINEKDARTAKSFYRKTQRVMRPIMLYGYPSSDGKGFDYIGITDNKDQRTRAHYREKGYSPSSMKILKHFHSRKRAMAVEAQMIKRFNPIDNIDHKPVITDPVVIIAEPPIDPPLVSYIDNGIMITFNIECKKVKRKYRADGIDAVKAQAEEDFSIRFE